MTAPRSMLIDLEFAFLLWRLSISDVCAFSSVRAVVKLAKIVTILCFVRLIRDIKSLNWIFIFYDICEIRFVFYIRIRRRVDVARYGIIFLVLLNAQLIHKYRMKLKFISDPIYVVFTASILIIYWTVWIVLHPLLQEKISHPSKLRYW